MLIYLYISSLIVGGLLLGGSILLGGDGHDGGGGGHDADLDADADADHDAADASHSHGDASGYLTLFLSLRFWTFFLAFAGLTGLVLQGLGLVGPMFGLALALGMGAFTGYGAAASLRLLSKTEANSAVSSSDYIGKSARVLVPFGKGTKGKVRVRVRGEAIDMVATAVDDGDFSRREEVLVVEVDGTVARVARAQALPGGSEKA